MCIHSLLFIYKPGYPVSAFRRYRRLIWLPNACREAPPESYRVIVGKAPASDVPKWQAHNERNLWCITTLKKENK